MSGSGNWQGARCDSAWSVQATYHLHGRTKKTKSKLESLESCRCGRVNTA